MFKPERLNFEELSRFLHEYEQKYGYSMIEFYRRFMDGELGDDDDMLMWGQVIPPLPDLLAGPSVHAARAGNGVIIDERKRLA